MHSPLFSDANQTLGSAVAVPIMLIVLSVALRLQFRARQYVAWTYWLVVVAVAVFGTSWIAVPAIAYLRFGLNEVLTSEPRPILSAELD
jgi:uncharacterized membrane-anchored protein